MSFDLKDYVDVPERIRMFKERYPNGVLQSEVQFVDGGVLCKAWAHTGTEQLPGIGHAFEPIPGKTPYTRDSEVMNAETSAWGRAIVALGFETKKIASANEVRARQGAPEPTAPVQERSAEVAESSSADATASASGAFKAPTGPRGGKADKIEVDALREELEGLVKTLGATDSLPTIEKKAEAGDAAWLKRQIATAKKQIEKNLEEAPFV